MKFNFINQSIIIKVGLFQKKKKKKSCFICFNESPLKVIKVKKLKNASYLILKALFVLKIFKFCLDFLVISEKWLDQKDKVTFKIYDVPTWLINNFNMLSNTSQSKGNQVMKFG